MVVHCGIISDFDTKLDKTGSCGPQVALDQTKTRVTASQTMPAVC